MKLRDIFKKKPKTLAPSEPQSARPERLRDLATGEHPVGPLVISWANDTDARGEFSEPYLDANGKPIPGATARWSRLILPMVAPDEMPRPASADAVRVSRPSPNAESAVDPQLAQVLSRLNR